VKNRRDSYKMGQILKRSKKEAEDETKVEFFDLVEEKGGRKPGRQAC